jgi:glutathione transport system substrate-binding protein
MSNHDAFAKLEELNKVTLTRRHALKLSLGVVGTAAALPLLAACGDDEDDADEDAPATDTEDDEPADEPEEDEAESDETEDEGEEDPAEEDDEDTAEEPEGEGQQGGELRYALSADPPNLDPHLSTGTASRTVKLQAYNGLLMYTDDSEIIGALATDWEVSDDGTEYSFDLREGVTFHDGSEFSVEDVIASFERIQDESTGAQRGPELRTVSEMNSDDDYHFTMVLEEPNVALLEYLAQPETSILSGQFLEEDGDPNTDMVGTGPFVFQEYEPGVRIVFERNEDYWRDGYPYLDRIVFTPYPDENTRVSALQGGDADIADYIPWRDFQTMEDDEAIELVNSPASSFMCIQYNTAREPFDDPAVRRALAYAFDREAMIQSAFFGRAEEITGGLIPRDSFAYAEDLEGTYTYDPDRARELLAEAGYEDGFSATLMSTSQYGMHQNTAEVAESNLSDIGIDVELELLDWSTVTDRHNEGDYDFRVHGLAPDSNDPDFLTLFFYPGSVHSTSTGFEDEEITNLLDEGRATTDEDERIEIYHQIEERLIELQPFNFLVYREDAEAIHSYVQGYRRLSGGVGFLSGVFLQEVWLDQ